MSTLQSSIPINASTRLLDKYVLPKVALTVISIASFIGTWLTMLKQARVDNDTPILRLTRQLLQYLLQHDSKSATAVFATTAELQTATTILTNHLEKLEHE